MAREVVGRRGNISADSISTVSPLAVLAIRVHTKFVVAVSLIPTTELKGFPEPTPLNLALPPLAPLRGRYGGYWIRLHTGCWRALSIYRGSPFSIHYCTGLFRVPPPFPPLLS